MSQMIVKLVSQILVKPLIELVSKVFEELSRRHIVHMTVVPREHLVQTFIDCDQPRIDQRFIGEEAVCTFGAELRDKLSPQMSEHFVKEVVNVCVVDSVEGVVNVKVIFVFPIVF